MQDTMYVNMRCAADVKLLKLEHNTMKKLIVVMTNNITPSIVRLISISSTAIIGTRVWREPVRVKNTIIVKSPTTMKVGLLSMVLVPDLARGWLLTCDAATETT